MKPDQEQQKPAAPETALGGQPANAVMETSPEASDIPTRLNRRRKIDAGTIADMAKLCAKMLTETESCHRLGIRPRAWFDFKSRCGRGDKFRELIEAFRAQKIESLLDRVQKSADGVDTKYPEFRAALALLKFHDQKRFGDSPSVEINNQVIACPLLPDQMLEIERMVSRKHGAVDCPAPKQLEYEK